jgi:hypothetical protein
MKVITCLNQLFLKSYWNKVNFIEFVGFTVKLSILIPGLLFSKQWWWLYIFALVSSLGLVITSVKKNLPTIAYFNLGWCFVSITSLIKHFW